MLRVLVFNSKVKVMSHFPCYLSYHQWDSLITQVWCFAFNLIDRLTAMCILQSFTLSLALCVAVFLCVLMSVFTVAAYTLTLWLRLCQRRYIGGWELGAWTRVTTKIFEVWRFPDSSSPQGKILIDTIASYYGYRWKMA